jgi:hypothetical protein
MATQAHLAVTRRTSPYPVDEGRRCAPPEPCLDVAHSLHAERCDPDKCKAVCEEPWCGWEHRQQKIDALRAKAMRPTPK